MLVDVGSVTTETTVLGTATSMPVLVAPTAFQRLAHPDGEKATARGAEAAGTIFCLSTAATAAPDEIAAAAPRVTRWFQLYWPPDRDFARTLVERAAEAGFTAIVLTVDLPRLGRRERDLRAAFDLPEDMRVPAYDAWEAHQGTAVEALDWLVDRTLTWRDLEWLRSLTELPLLIKGIHTAEDALLAVEHGADALVVSNHGGRQLDGVAATLDTLPEVVEAVGERCEVLLDGGVRRGTDVLKALALGARAVLVGRPALWGLAVAGAEGVQRVLELLRAEIELGLVLLGCASPEAVSRAHVARAVS
jgi:isopentenyl diphosphate isomerase/L-lactate dehydrogenase-like FMN-dependent dehydrogenase